MLIFLSYYKKLITSIKDMKINISQPNLKRFSLTYIFNILFFHFFLNFSKYLLSLLFIWDTVLNFPYSDNLLLYSWKVFDQHYGYCGFFLLLMMYMSYPCHDTHWKLLYTKYNCSSSCDVCLMTLKLRQKITMYHPMDYIGQELR